MIMKKGSPFFEQFFARPDKTRSVRRKWNPMITWWYNRVAVPHDYLMQYLCVQYCSLSEKKKITTLDSLFLYSIVSWNILTKITPIIIDIIDCTVILQCNTLMF